MRRVFAGLNLFAALVLTGAGFALPARVSAVDVPVTAVVVLLVVCNVAAIVSNQWAPRALRVSAWALLSLGLFIVGIAVLAVGFLLGIHGELGSTGSLVMALIAAFIIPYAIVYPAFSLYAFRHRVEL
jgi:hypothetical protein